MKLQYILIKKNLKLWKNLKIYVLQYLKIQVILNLETKTMFKHRLSLKRIFGKMNLNCNHT